ncbi:hypothetical protein [Actinomycetospora chiangmaiensis]|uniref:hypothetical protein n=1 Tax=Actinomycetospora chiangmaiensis TaxID=402650 RepID=UPI00036046AA|nr:hypothetical protein [Actinomycetospora chiangmaiensis]
MAFIVVLVLFIVVGTAYSIYNTIVARQGVDLEVAGSRQDVLAATLSRSPQVAA